MFNLAPTTMNKHTVKKQNKICFKMVLSAGNLVCYNAIAEKAKEEIH